MKKILYLFFVSILLFSCKPRQKQPFGRDLGIENKKWVLQEMNGKTVSIPTDGKIIFLQFEPGNNIFEGNGGCNVMNGMFTVAEDMIKLQSMATTKMACSQLQTESEYFQVLEKANRYEIKKKREKGVDKLSLLLYEDTNLTATFEAVQ